MIPAQAVRSFMTDIFSYKIGFVTVEQICEAVVLFAVGYLLIRFIVSLVRKGLDKTRLDQRVRGLIALTVKVLLYILLALSIAGSLNISVTSFVAALSVVGIAFSLALQNLLTNLVGGMAILVANLFKKGDYIEYNGLEGTVDEVGIVYTKLLTVENKTVWIPNGEISQGKLTNCTEQPLRRIQLFITASYDSDPAKVREALEESALRVPQILPDPPVLTGVWEYQESCISYLLRAWVRTEDFLPARLMLTEEIKKVFDEEGLIMTYPHLNVHLDRAE